MLPADVDAAPASFSHNPLDHHKLRIVLVPMDVSCKALQVDITIEEGLLAQLDALAGRIQANRSTCWLGACTSCWQRDGANFVLS